jgi:hypothetical protein
LSSCYLTHVPTSPTFGFLNFGTAGSHTGSLFDWMAPSAPDAINLADVGFMVALLGIASAGAGVFALQPWFDRRFPGLSWLK